MCPRSPKPLSGRTNFQTRFSLTPKPVYQGEMHMGNIRNHFKGLVLYPWAICWGSMRDGDRLCESLSSPNIRWGQLYNWLWTTYQQCRGECTQSLPTEAPIPGGVKVLKPVRSSWTAVSGPKGCGEPLGTQRRGKWANLKHGDAKGFPDTADCEVWWGR